VSDCDCAARSALDRVPDDGFHKCALHRAWDRVDWLKRREDRDAQKLLDAASEYADTVRFRVIAEEEAQVVGPRPLSAPP
jgi:hypothetical protein